MGSSEGGATADAEGNSDNAQGKNYTEWLSRPVVPRLGAVIIII